MKRSFVPLTLLKAAVMAACAVVVCGAALAGVSFIDGNPLDPEMQEKVRAALARLKQAPADTAAIETLLAVEPQVVDAVGTNHAFSGTDPLRNEALQWCQTLQPADVLEGCLDKGSNAAVHWALRQIVWRLHNRKDKDGFDEKGLARLLPGIERALTQAEPATRAQAVRTKVHCLPDAQRAPFLQGLLQGQPDEVTAEAIAGLVNKREVNAEIEVIVARWLKTSENPVLLNACCSYWWLVKSRHSVEVTAEQMAAFERLAALPDITVRCAVTRVLAEVATPERPRMVGLLLRLTSDKETRVQHDAIRALRHANTAQVKGRLLELFALDQPAELRTAAMEVLGVFGGENLPLIIQAAKTDPERGVRQNAVYALRIIGTDEAGAALEVAAKDADVNVQREAREQLEWFRKEHGKKP
ncbi:HEAT repeat domain-containing protein [Prosthecobacter sp.]|uniref:HEAT repeat domain-containing protein n=1 Tax=Prosthecobacter sp. TaxID=1965333 RepID=UPI003782F0F7